MAGDSKGLQGHVTAGMFDADCRHLDGPLVVNVPPLSCETLMEVSSLRTNVLDRLR